MGGRVERRPERLGELISEGQRIVIVVRDFERGPRVMKILSEKGWRGSLASINLQRMWMSEI